MPVTVFHVDRHCNIAVETGCVSSAAELSAMLNPATTLLLLSSCDGGDFGDVIAGAHCCRQRRDQYSGCFLMLLRGGARQLTGSAVATCSWNQRDSAGVVDLQLPVPCRAMNETSEMQKIITQ